MKSNKLIFKSIFKCWIKISAGLLQLPINIYFQLVSSLYSIILFMLKWRKLLFYVSYLITERHQCHSPVGGLLQQRQQRLLEGILHTLLTKLSVLNGYHCMSTVCVTWWVKSVFSQRFKSEPNLTSSLDMYAGNPLLDVTCRGVNMWERWHDWYRSSYINVVLI